MMGRAGLLALCGFVSTVPWCSPHDDITARAARRARYPGDIRMLAAAVRRPDWQDFRFAPRPRAPLRFDATSRYDPSHHADRVPTRSDDMSALEATVSYIRDQRDEARRLLRSDARACIWALGRALHALQDGFSHSDYSDLRPDQRVRARRALLGRGRPPDLRLTGFEPGLAVPEDPDDDFPHHRFAKDSASMNPECRHAHPLGTKYDAAFRGATTASAALLRDFLRGMPLQRRRSLKAVRPGPLGPLALAGIAGDGWPLLGPVLHPLPARVRRAHHGQHKT